MWLDQAHPDNPGEPPHLKVCDPVVACLRAPVKLWQVNLLACKQSKISDPSQFLKLQLSLETELGKHI